MAVPYGWAVTSIGQVCDLVNGRAFKPSDWGTEGLPIIRIQNLNNPCAKFNYFSGNIESKFLVESGDLLFAWSGTPGTSFGAHIWNGGKSILNQHIFNVKFNTNYINRAFLKHAINSTLDEQIGKAHGGVGLRHVTKGKFEETVIHIPPLLEQCRIVAKIDSLTAKSKRARDHLDHVPRLIQKYKQEFLDSVFSNSEEDASSWQRLPLEMLASIGTGATPKSGNARYYEGGTISWVTSGAVNQHRIVHAEKMITEAAVRETNCKIYPPGTLLMAMYGEGLTRGKVAHLAIAAATNQALAAIQVDRNRMLPTFLLWFLHSRYLVLRAQAAGGVQPNLNLGIVKQIEVPCPPLSVQEKSIERITRAFAWIDRLACEATGAHKLIDRLDQAILSKAFRGELVPQDLNDEPASVLLERIRAERIGPSQSRKGRGRPRTVLA